jgi:branched-chain amino acid transport system substrate-binding protein
MARALHLVVAIAFSGVAPACTAFLDFDDQCSEDADCATVGRGLRCDLGQCVAKPLIDAEVGCDRLYGEDPRGAAPGTVITLGTLLPFSGALGSYGPGMDNAVRLAVNEINQNGGVDGVKLGVLGCDSGTSADIAEKAARHLVDVAGVPAIIGAGGSTVTIETFNRVARQSRVVMMTPSATSPAITNLPDDGLLWRTVPSDAIQGNAIAAYMRSEGFRKIVIVNRNDAYGNGLADVVSVQFCAEAVPACTGETFIQRLYSPVDLSEAQAEDQARIATDLELIAPDVVVLVGYMSDGLSFLNLVKEKRYRFILSDGMRDGALMAGVFDGDGNQLVPGLDNARTLCSILGTNPSSPSGELYAGFERRYEANFQTAPTTFAAHAYDAAYVVALGLAAAFGAGESAPGGRQLAEGIARLTRGEEIVVGVSAPGNFGRGVDILASSDVAGIDLVGVSGALDFDASLGEAPSGIEMWRFDPGTGEIVDLGQVFDGDEAYDFSSVAAAQTGVSCP